MNIKFIDKNNDNINQLFSKETSIYESQKKTTEESNFGKNETKNINNILDSCYNEKENENNKIFQLKKELDPMNPQINLITLEKMNNILYNGSLQNMINNNNINYLAPYKPLAYIQINDIIEKELQFYKLLEIGLKFLSNINNINNYLLKLLFSNYYSQNSIINKNINYKITIHRNLNENESQKKMNNNKNNFINESKNENNIKINLNNKPNINFIDINLILNGKEKRTVVRLHPIPQNYSSFDISKLIDKYLHIESGKNQRIYKALYVPLSKILGRNIGFCFIMMVETKYVINFYSAFNGINFNKKKARKPCSVIWADVQGDDFLKISDDPLRSPIIFKDLIIN